MFFFPFHIWDVIRNPLTNSMIFQDGYCTTNQTYGVWACLKFGYTASCRFKRANEDEAKICWGTFGAPYSRWTQVIKMVGFFRIFQAKKHQKAKKNNGFPRWDTLTSRLPKSAMLTFRDLSVRHEACWSQQALAMAAPSMRFPGANWRMWGFGMVIHAFTAIIWGWIHTYYPIFGGNEPSFTTYFDVRGFWCSLTMGDHGINVRISPAAAIAISSLWTPTFFGSDFDQGPRFFWLQRPSFCFCIQWQMYMYLSVCLSVCLFVYLYLYPDIYTRTHTHTHFTHVSWLVVWNIWTFFPFHKNGNVIIPTDFFFIFFRGVAQLLNHQPVTACGSRFSAGPRLCQHGFVGAGRLGRCRLFFWGNIYISMIIYVNMIMYIW